MVMKKITKILFHYDWEIVEVIGASFKIVWGIWLLLPFQTFYGTVVYDALSTVTTEKGWGLFILILGSIHLAAIINGVIKYRRFMLMIGCMFWVFITVVFAITRIGSGLVPMTMVLSFFLAVNYLRLGIPDLFSRFTGHK